ncbi:hypothetical protein ACO0LM_11830 [Undibacterium sp. Di26W]|uniref:hypothetical protein n=1 Tax=Undibacterium sp. Di26W TaxID=3413035 RepID=UPI003BF0AC71
MTTLSDGTTTIELDPDFWWRDEFDWQPVEQSETRTITGAIVIEAHARVGGRPITLEPPDESSAWLSRDVVTALQAFAAVPGKVMTLALNGTEYQVVFKRAGGDAVSAKPVVFFSNAAGSDYYLTTLKFMEV